MSRRLRHHRSAGRPCHVALTLVAVVAVLACAGVSVVGLVWGGDSKQNKAAAETFSVPASAPLPIAMTGPRSFALVAGLSDGRQRAGLFAGPGDASYSAFAFGLSDGAADIPIRRSLVRASGLLAVRAPPALAA
jgi:hypothetical protein